MGGRLHPRSYVHDLRNVFIYCNYHGFSGLSTPDSIGCIYSMNNAEVRFKDLIYDNDYVQRPCDTSIWNMLQYIETVRPD